MPRLVTWPVADLSGQICLIDEDEVAGREVTYLHV